MRHLFFALVFMLASLFVFYTGAVLISAKFWVSEMQEDTRQTVFGFWLGVYIVGMVCYGLDQSAKNK